MEKYVRKRDESGEVAETASPGGRKRKIVFGESEISLFNSASPARSGDSTCESVSSGNVSTPCCSSSSSRSSGLEKEIPKFAYLEENAVDVDRSAVHVHSVDFRERREKSPASEVNEPGELETTAMPLESNSRRFSTADEKMPTESELEEFFAAAEKHLQKKFIDKYNFDIVKEEPLDGRYEWVPEVQLKP